MYRVGALLCGLLWASLAGAQEINPPSPSDSLKSDTLLFFPPPDTRLIVPVTDSIDLEKRLTQQPTIGLFKSMLLPGWGQFGNRRYTKALIFAGLETWFVGSAIHYGRQAGDRRTDWEQIDEGSIDARNIAYGLYVDRRDERNKFIWFAGLTVFISMFDAYVDAHLSGAPTDPRHRRVDVGVAPSGDGAVLQLSASF